MAWSRLELVGVTWSGLEWVEAQCDKALLKHLKIFNFGAPLNFTWIIIAPFTLTQLICLRNDEFLALTK